MTGTPDAETPRGRGATVPTKGSHWRVTESRRMIEDARALVSIAEGLKDWSPSKDPGEGDGPRRDPRAPARAVLVHAISLDEGDVIAARPEQEPPKRELSILVLLDDAPAVPDFLPEGTDADLEHPTEEAVRSAIERRVRGALAGTPTDQHVLDLVESIRDAVIMIDRERRVVYLNTSATSLLQTLTSRTGPFIGQPVASAFPPSTSATVRPAIQSALVDADATHIEDPERHRGLALDIAIFPNPQGATLLVRDVTERKEIEEELIQTRLSLARAEARLRARDDEAQA